MHDEAPPARRSDATRALILAAAREHFGAAGYRGATIRAIAAKAGIDPALVMRYFGNKEKLFAAAAEFDLQLPDLGSIPRADVGGALAKHFLDRWENDEALMALLRTAVTHEAAAERMRSIFAAQLGPVVASLSGVPRASAASRAGMIATQMLGLALCRYLLKLPPVVAMKRAELVRQLGPTIERYLFDPAP